MGEQLDERQCSVHPPFRGVNTEQAERTDNIVGTLVQR